METTLAHSLPTDERTLVRRAQAGDVEAFGALVSQYMRRAYYAALGLVGSHDDALDLSQEVFSRGLSCPHVDPNRSFYTWLYTILRRLCFNFLRDRKAQSQKLAEAAGWLAEEARTRVAAHSPVRAAELAELRSRVAGAMEPAPGPSARGVGAKGIRGSAVSRNRGTVGNPHWDGDVTPLCRPQATGREVGGEPQ